MDKSEGPRSVGERSHTQERSRARPRLSRRERQEQTRERLLDAAAQVFAQRGFASASLEEISEVAGYTRGAVYANFAGKSELFLALVGRRVERGADDVGKELEGLSRPEDVVAAMAAQFAEAGQSDPEWILLAVEFWLYAIRNPDARAALAEEYARSGRRFAELIERGYGERGLDPPASPEAIAAISEALATGLHFRKAIDPGLDSEWLYGLVMSRLLDLPGLRPRPTTGSSRATSAADREGVR